MSHSALRPHFQAQAWRRIGYRYRYEAGPDSQVTSEGCSRPQQNPQIPRLKAMPQLSQPVCKATSHTWGPPSDFLQLKIPEEKLCLRMKKQAHCPGAAGSCLTREGPPFQAIDFQQPRNQAAQESALRESCLGYSKISPVVDFHLINFPKGFALTLLNANAADKLRLLASLRSQEYLRPGY